MSAALTDEQLHEATVLALALTKINAARLYGFIEGGPEINLERIEDVLAQARERGIEATPGEVEAATNELLAEWAA